MHDEIKHSDWLFQVTLPNLTNQSTLFQHSFATLKFVHDIVSWYHSCKCFQRSIEWLPKNLLMTSGS